MTTLTERSHQWQGHGGPAQWDQAWDRTRELIGSRLEKFSDHDSDETGADGICGLATALYVIAVSRGIEARDVSRDDVDELIRRRPGEKDPDIVLRWQTHLQLAGHYLEHPTDPVAVRWRALRVIHDPDDEYEDSLVRHGPALLEGLRYVLSPHVALTF